MKHLLTLLSFAFIVGYTYGQSVVTTSSSESGILVGSSKGFAGIGYENANGKFAFNYKFVKQDDTIYNNRRYPDFWGINIGTGIKIDKGKTNLVSDRKWQGGVDFDFTVFRTWDKTTSSSEGTLDSDGVRHRRANIAQKTLFLRLSNARERFNYFESKFINQDTTYLTLHNPMQNVFTMNPGFYTMKQCHSRFYFSWAVSANISFINKSTRKLSETNLIPTTGIFYNLKDSTKIQQFDNQSTYYSGTPEFEVFFVPRGDVFLRYSLGDSKPIIGLLFAYSPLISSLKSVEPRNSVVFGPTFGLPTFPDQVLFAVLNEFNQNKEGKYTYALIFQATFPILFN